MQTSFRATARLTTSTRLSESDTSVTHVVNAAADVSPLSAILQSVLLMPHPCACFFFSPRYQLVEPSLSP